MSEINAVAKLVKELRNKESRDNRELLDKAADTIERMYGDFYRYHQERNDFCDCCEYLVELPECVDAEYDCCECQRDDCPCKTCQMGSNWKWRGA